MFRTLAVGLGLAAAVLAATPAHAAEIRYTGNVTLPQMIANDDSHTIINATAVDQPFSVVGASGAVIQSGIIAAGGSVTVNAFGTATLRVGGAADTTTVPPKFWVSVYIERA